MMRATAWPILALLVLFTRAFGNVDALPQGASRQIENGHAVIALAFSPDGKTLAACCDDDNIHCWDVRTGRQGRCLELTPEGSHERRIRSNINSPRLAFSANGNTVSASFPVGVVEKGEPSWFDVIKQWDLSTGKELREIRGEKGESLVVIRDIGGALLGIGMRKDRLRGWDLTSGEERFAWRMRKHVQEFKANWHFKAISANAQVVVMSTTLAGALRPLGTDHACQETNRGQILRDINDRESGVDSPLALSPNGRIIAVAVGIRDAEKIRLWETQTEPNIHAPRYEWEKPPPPPAVPAFKGDVTCLNFSPDAKMLSIAGQSGTVCLWETATAKERNHFIGQQGPILALAFSPNGRLLAAGGRDGIVCLWDVKPPEASERAHDAKLSSKQLQTLWDRLAGKDALAAYRAIHRMRAAPQQAVPFLKLRLPLLMEADHQRIESLLVDLDSDQYAVRAKADEELRKWGVSALPLLTGALKNKPSLEVRRRVEAIIVDIRKSQSKLFTMDRLRSVRAVEVLEHSGTAEAKEILRLLAKRAADAYLRQEAQEATRRLASGEKQSRVRKDR